MDEARKELVEKVASKLITIEAGLVELKALDQAQLVRLLAFSPFLYFILLQQQLLPPHRCLLVSIAKATSPVLTCAIW